MTMQKLEEDVTDMYHAGAVHELPNILLAMSQVSIEKLPYPKLLNIPLAVSLKLNKLPSSLKAVNIALSILRRPKIKVSQLEAHVEFLQLFAYIAKAISKIKVKEC